VRKPIKPQVVRAEFTESPIIRMLLVTARPNGKYDVGYRTISRPLVETLEKAKLRVLIDILRPATFEAFVNKLEDVGNGYYHIVHLDMHGSLVDYDTYLKLAENKEQLQQHAVTFRNFGRDEIEKYDGLKAFLSFEPYDDGKVKDNGLVEADAIAKKLQTYGVPIIILNACQSGKQVGSDETSCTNRCSNALFCDSQCC